MKWCLVLAAVLALAASSASARESRSEARPVTLATVPGQVTGLSQDRNRIAWIVPNERCGHNVQVLTLPRRHPVTVGRRRDASCEGETLETVALGGRRLLWQGLTGTGNTELDVGLYTATLGSPRARRAGELSISRDPQDPDYVDPVPLLTASDGNTILVYWLCDDYCNRIDAGSVRRLAGGRTVRLARAVRPVGLAVAGSRFAVLTNTQRCCNYTPAWSPDGKRIAWILRGDVWTIAADGTDDRRLTTVGDAEAPAWSSDGTQLAFDRSAAGSTPSIYRIAADGSGLQRLATGSGPAWSPDGTRIAFVRANDVYTIKPDGTGETRLTTDAVLNTFDLTWSPDGTKIAATRNGRIHIIRADGGGDLTIAAGFNPDWSPDGTKLVSSSGTSGLYGLFVIKPDGSGNTQITTEVDEHPDWSPNGTRIVFANSSRSPAGIWSVNADGSNPTPLSQGIIGENPHWAPDGSTVAFADDPVDSDGGTGLRLVSPTGTNLRTI